MASPRSMLVGFALALVIFSSSSPASAAEPWLTRWAPENHTFELGLHGGLTLLDERHSLFRPDPTDYLDGYRRLRGPNPTAGLRLGYFPLRFVGIELEGGLTPSRLRDEPGAALIYTARGHVIAQLGLWSVVPFVMLGGGAIGIDSNVLGDDIDPALHFGAGMKLSVARWVTLRIDVRDLVSHQQGAEGPLTAHHLEVLAGLSFVIRPREPD